MAVVGTDKKQQNSEVLRSYNKNPLHGLAEQFTDIAKAGLNEGVDFYSDPSRFFQNPTLSNQMKKFFIESAFDPNDPTTVASFRSAVQPILEDFITKRALVDAKLVIDDSEETRDRLEINAQIYLKFMPNLEYINIGLIATPQGVSFDDI